MSLLFNFIFLHQAIFADKGKLYFPTAVYLNTADFKKITKSDEVILKIINLKTDNVEKIELAKVAEQLFITKDKIYDLNVGHYKVKEIELNRKDKDIQLNYKIDFEFFIEKGKLTPIKTFLLELTDISSGAHKIHYVNKNYIDFSILKKHIKSLNEFEVLVKKSKDQLYVEKPFVHNTKTKSYYGYKFSLPCNFKGETKLNLSFNKSPVSQYVISKFYAGCRTLENRHRFSVKLNLFEGDWEINSIGVSSPKYVNNTFYNLLKHLGLLEFYNTDYYQFTKNNGYFKEFNDDIVFSSTAETLYKFNYVGTFLVDEKPSNEEFYEVNFNRAYDVRTIRKSFYVRSVNNPFNNARVIRDKVLGNMLIYIKEIKANHLSNGIKNEIKEDLITVVKKCVLIQEKINPLLSVNGSILVKNEKNKINLKQESFKFEESGQEISEIKQCIDKSFSNKNYSVGNENFLLEVLVYSL